MLSLVELRLYSEQAGRALTLGNTVDDHDAALDSGFAQMLLTIFLYWHIFCW
jgi:hypothetical protein